MYLKPYQQEVVNFCLSRKNSLVALDMGTGKSAIAIEVMNRVPGIPRTLIVCPASVQLNWLRELEFWGRKPYFPAIISTGKPVSLSENIWIISYNLLHAWRSAIREKIWDILILDEAHYLKNSKSIRSKEVFGCSKKSNFITPIPTYKTIALTGTPILNRPLEFWPLVRAFDLHGLGRDWFSFVHKYCNAHQRRVSKTRTILDCTGASNLEDLHKNVQKFMIRRTKKEVLSQLPTKTRQKILLPSEKMSKEIKEEKTIASLGKGASVLGDLIKARIAVAKKKLPLVIEHVKNILEQGEKCVVFFWHHEIGDALFEEFKDVNPARLDGRMNTQDRQNNIDKFQTDESCRLFIGSIAAAGVGVTLTAASVSVFAEISWVPGELLQAEDRIHRIGQEKPVLIQYLVVEDSVDDRMLETLTRKKEIISKIV